jgi:hypothetical protein
MLDVDAHGIVHVGWRQRNETPGDPTARSATGLSPHIDTYYAESIDHGKTWSAPLRVNRKRTDVGYAAFSRGGAFLGDYNQVAAASNGTTYLVHNEALPSKPGEKCNCSFSRGNGHQHQYTYVAVIGRSVDTQGSTLGPDSTGTGRNPAARSSSRPPNDLSLAHTGAAAALPLAGVALLVLAATLRRRRPTRG